MSSFASGLMSVGKKLGGSASDWAQGTKIGRAIDKGRNVVGSFSAKRQTGMKGKSDSGILPDPSGSQDA